MNRPRYRHLEPETGAWTSVVSKNRLASPFYFLPRGNMKPGTSAPGFGGGELLRTRLSWGCFREVSRFMAMLDHDILLGKRRKPDAGDGPLGGRRLELAVYGRQPIFAVAV